jgi:PAS domain S-box-containing protein
MTTRKPTARSRAVTTPKNAARLAEQFRATFEQAAVGMAHVDPSGRWLRVNQKLLDMVGYTADELMRLTFQDITYPQDLGSDLALLERLLAGEITTYALEKRYIRKDGSLIWANLTVFLVRTPTGEPDYCISVVEDIATRKRLEEIVDLANERLSDVLDSIAEAFFAIDRDWRCTYLNPAGEAFMRRPANEVIGQNVWDLFPLARESAAYHRLHEVMEQCRPATFETHAPPAEQWLELRANPTPDGISVLVRDVTAQRIREAERVELLAREQAARREAETAHRRLADVLAVLPAGVILTDATGRMLQKNPEADRIFRGELPLAQNISGCQASTGWLLDGHQLAPDEWALAQALRGITVRGQEVEILALDGTHRLIDNNAVPIHDDVGQITGAVVAFLDITARRALEQRTHAALQALLLMAQAITVPAADASLSGTQQVIDLVQHVFGASYVGLVEIDGQTEKVRPLAVAGLAPAVAERWREHLNDIQMQEYLSQHFAARLRSGEIVHVDLVAQPAVADQDSFTLQTVLAVPADFADGTWGILSIEALDHDGFAPQEVELARGAMHLVKLVLERDRLLSERALARELADAAEATRVQMDEFLGIAGHELRSPLTALMMSVQMTQMRLRRLRPTLSAESLAAATPQLDQLDDLMARTFRQTRRMERLVGDLLDLSRIDAGSLALRPEPCDLAQVVRETVAEQHEAAPDRDMTLELPGEPVPVEADPDRIGQVVTNFLTNALKYSAGDAPIAVRLQVRGHAAIVEVTDHGPGISAAQQEHLWERFYRVPGITQQHGSGASLGLGLYICKTIIERHNGRIGVTSTPGDGSTFWFALPL